MLHWNNNKRKKNVYSINSTSLYPTVVASCLGSVYSIDISFRVLFYFFRQHIGFSLTFLFRLRFIWNWWRSNKFFASVTLAACHFKNWTFTQFSTRNVLFTFGSYELFSTLGFRAAHFIFYHDEIFVDSAWNNNKSRHFAVACLVSTPNNHNKRICSDTSYRLAIFIQSWIWTHFLYVSFELS